MPKFKYPDVVQFTAYGIPQTKGSTRSFVKGEKVITTNDNPKTKDWHHIVAMKALSVWQPHATLIDIEAKQIETRGWATRYRGPLAIHASKGFPAGNRFLYLSELFCGTLTRAGYENANKLPLGAVIATCNLVDCVKIIGRTSIAGKIVAAQLSDGREVEGNELAFGDYTPGRFAWILEDVRPLPEPIPVKGQQGLWTWEPPESVKW